MIYIQYLDHITKKKKSKVEEELYWFYKNELWEIAKEHGCSRSVVNEWYEDIILHNDIYLIRIYNEPESENPYQIGFMFIGVNDSCHEDADYYIWDSYILPKYRRQHTMEIVFQVFVKAQNHVGKYCLFILDDNVKAINFWVKQFEMLGYKECPIEDYNKLETPWCHLHAYEG